MPSAPTEVVPEAGIPASTLLLRALQTLMGRGGMLVLSLGVTIALAHVLAPAARGKLAVLQALAGIIAVCANLGVAKAVVHHTAKGLVARRAAVAGATILALASAGGAGVVILGGASFLGGHLLGGLGPALVAAALGLAGLQLVREYVSGVLVAAGRSFTLVWVTAAQPAVTLLVLITVAVTSPMIISVHPSVPFWWSRCAARADGAPSSGRTFADSRGSASAAIPRW